MRIKRVVTWIVLGVMGLGVGPVRAQPQTGVLAGHVSDTARQPFSDYTIRLRDVQTGQLVTTQAPDRDGRFSFMGVPLSRPFLVELFQITKDRIVCTEGPYSLTTSRPDKRDVNISCGKAPAALWIILAGSGAAAALAVATRSPSR